MTSIHVQTTNYFVENRSWNLSEHGTEPGAMPGCTLDVSTFTAATHFPNGFIPSGVILGVITAATAAAGGSLVVGPYDPAATDGRATPRGVLWSTTTVPNLADLTLDVGGALLVHGFVKRSRLPLQSGIGGATDAAVAALPLIVFS